MTRRTRGGAAALAAAACCASLTGCAAHGDVHLEPLFARFATADGGIETEALFGLFRRRVGGRGPAEQTTVGPLMGLDREEDGDWRSRYLVPLGWAHGRDGEALSTLIPVYVWQRVVNADGTQETRLVSLPGWLVRSSEEEGTDFAWFPFYGNLERFLVFDRLFFFLWPLYMETEGGGSTGRHLLFPFFALVRGEGKRGFRVFPLVGRAAHPGSYERWFWLWPFFHLHRELLSTDEPMRKWLAWPLLGRTTRGSYEAWTTLWPFFGWASDPEEGFWALDAPWPLVRLRRGPEVHRTRFWPLYSYLRADQLETRSFLWPIVFLRHERYRHARRDSSYVVPVWQRWVRVDERTGERSSWIKVFPLFQHETEGDWRRGSFPTLDPFQRNEVVDRHYAWLWKLWEWEEEADRRHVRSWAGLWRGEHDAHESRTSLGGLWARRRVRTPGGGSTETSILFGLLRWRVTEEEGFDMLAPSVPGPGWPRAWADRPGEPAP